MKLDEARVVLGLDGDIDADLLRRAYLRALKRHKPERDPEGFQRVRTAYELLSAAPWGWRSPASAGPLFVGSMAHATPPLASLQPRTEVPPASPVPDAAVLDALDAAVPDAAVLDAGALDAAVLDAAAPELQAEPLALGTPPSTRAPDREARLAAIHDELDQAEPAAHVEILRRATREHPDIQELFHELADLLADDDDGLAEDTIVEVLRAGAAAGHPSCALRLRDEHPGFLDERDLDTLRAEGTPWSESVLARALVLQGRSAEAAQVALASLARDRESLSPAIPPSLWLDLVLRLHQECDLASALAVDRAMREQVVRVGGAATLARTEQLRYELARQLAALDDAFPPHLRSEIARAIREGDLEIAAGEANRLCDVAPSRATVAADRLTQHAPDIAAVLAPFLSRDHAPTKPTSDPNLRFLSSIIGAAFFVVMYAARSCSPSPHPPTLPPAYSGTPAAHAPHPTRARAEANLAVERVCQGAYDDVACRAAWRWLDAYEEHDCAAAAIELAAIEAATPSSALDRLIPSHRDPAGSSPATHSEMQSRRLSALHRARCPDEGAPPR